MRAKIALFKLINRAGAILPKRVQRFIADFPGVLQLLGKLSRNSHTQVRTPEGTSLFINPLFHSNLAKKDELTNYEPALREAIIRLTQTDFTAYDVGANVGVFSFLFSSCVGPQGRVYAFEPEKNNYICLERSIEANNDKNIVLDKRAVGDKSAVLKFDRRGGAFSGRLIGNSSGYATTDNIVDVSVTTIDVAVYDQGYQEPDIVKIDVEGNEALVLAGMSRILDERPPIIICELHSHLGDAVEKVGELLRDRSYRLYEINRFVKTSPENLSEVSSLNGVHHVVAIPPASSMHLKTA